MQRSLWPAKWIALEHCKTVDGPQTRPLYTCSWNGTRWFFFFNLLILSLAHSDSLIPESEKIQPPCVIVSPPKRFPTLCDLRFITGRDDFVQLMSTVRRDSCVLRDGGPCLVCKEDMELEKKIQELQDRRRILRTHINASHDPFHSKFPPEIASLIFSLCMRVQEHEPNVHMLRMLPTPFLLGSVSRRWRQLTRSTPQLWSTLSFTLDKQTGIETLPQIQVVSDWLQLSGSLPLAFYIFISSRRKTKPDAYGPVIDALNQHSGRWHTAVLHLPTPLFNRFCGTSPPRNLCDLRLIDSPNNSSAISPTFRMNSPPSPTSRAFLIWVSTLGGIIWPFWK